MADRFAALRVERLVVRGFRNLEDLDLAPGPRFNVVSGDNGQGKSNLLEAIYYLGALRSFRGAGREDLIAHAGSRAVLAARFSAEPAPIAARVGIDRDKARQLALNDKRPRSTASWVGAVPMVLFHPGDVALAGGSPESRRGFLDRILEQMDPTYPGALAAYTKALRSRNRLLKMGGDRRAIVAYDELLASSGAIVGQARRQLAQDLAPRVGDCFASVAGEELALEVAYRPRVDPSVASIRAALAASIDTDLARGFTADGPHGDDLSIRVRERSARHHASQGQQRMIVLALKLAELGLLTERKRTVPVLLLDDVSSELDRTKNARFFEVLEGIGAQVFVTTTHAELIAMDRERTDLRVRGGRVEIA